jgi:hypothetical protein
LPGKEIAQLRRAQPPVEINETVDVPLMAYLCDTTVDVLAEEPQATEWIFKCPVVMIECTYLDSSAKEEKAEVNDKKKQKQPKKEEEAQEGEEVEPTVVPSVGKALGQEEIEARKRGHSSWIGLRPYIESHPEICWILFHFSSRYSDEEIRQFFQTASSEGTRPPNVVAWLDSGVDYPEQYKQYAI